MREDELSPETLLRQVQDSNEPLVKQLVEQIKENLLREMARSVGGSVYTINMPADTSLAVIERVLQRFRKAGWQAQIDYANRPGERHTLRFSR